MKSLPPPPTSFMYSSPILTKSPVPKSVLLKLISVSELVMVVARVALSRPVGAVAICISK